MLLGGELQPKSDASDVPSPTPVANGPYNASLLPALDNLDQSPLGPRRVLVSSEGGDREDDERRKFETPEVIGGLSEPGLGSPKQPPTLPSIPPLDVPPETAEGTTGTGGWELLPIKRGREHEQIFGHNLHPNYPTVDRWEVDSGTVTSLKSVDLNSPTYRNEAKNTLYNKLSRDLNKLAKFHGSEYAETKIPEYAIKSRTLKIIVPNAGTAAQQEVMRRIVELGRQRGVTVDVIIYP
jgi:hypothetical protein